MKSITILTFSGTGNTQFIINELIKVLIDNGSKAKSVTMEYLEQEKSLLDLLNVDLIGIAFPVHSFNPPLLVEKTIKRLPKTPFKRCFIIKTAGSPWINGGTTTKLQRIIRQRNWYLQHESLILMPSNFITRPSDNFIKLICDMAIKQVSLIAQELLQGEKKILSKSKITSLLSSIMRIERWGAYYLGYKWLIEETCIKCGKCIRGCPTKNIKFSDGKFIFGRKCLLCMRCSFLCPTQAFSNKLFGKKLFVKPPFNLNRIMNEDLIDIADILDDTIPQMREFRDFWWRSGLID